MGLFDFFKKKSERRDGGARTGLSCRGIDGSPADFNDEEFRREREEQERRAEEDAARQREFQNANRSFMLDNGVDVDMFDAEKVMTDSLRTIESICPCMLRFDRGISREEPHISFSSPTKTGKVPKNVVEAYVCHEERRARTDRHGYEWFEYGDSLRVSISYLADGRINKFDVVGRHDGSVVNVAIRRKGDSLLMASAGTYGATGEWQSLCPGADPSTGDMLAALNEEVQRIY